MGVNIISVCVTLCPMSISLFDFIAFEVFYRMYMEFASGRVQSRDKNLRELNFQITNQI